jgi:hypothetical protein
MRKNVLFPVLVVFICLTLLFFYQFLKRINLPYNSEGNYFDEESLITYKAQAAEVYGTLAFACLLFTGIFLYKMILLKNHYNR